MILVRDIDDQGIFFYWSDSETPDTPISARIPCIELAKEWRDKHMFSLYRGDERRHSHIDRRSNREKRKKVDKALFYERHSPEGRRSTDKPIQIDMDLAVVKVELYS